MSRKNRSVAKVCPGGHFLDSNNESPLIKTGPRDKGTPGHQDCLKMEDKMDVSLSESSQSDKDLLQAVYNYLLDKIYPKSATKKRKESNSAKSHKI